MARTHSTSSCIARTCSIVGEGAGSLGRRGPFEAEQMPLTLNRICMDACVGKKSHGMVGMPGDGSLTDNHTCRSREVVWWDWSRAVNEGSRKLGALAICHHLRIPPLVRASCYLLWTMTLISVLRDCLVSLFYEGGWRIRDDCTFELTVPAGPQLNSSI